ncbi:MAG: hypothetical protein DRN81_06180 [Thermoproteota archaeon]|nr:MAG: hypothetical protein DRN81_06180 [Candidatus Korarchaeota archaeon]
MDDIESKILRNLARCRRTYSEKMTTKQMLMLLENTMVQIQDLLYLKEVDYWDFEPDETLEA